MAEQGTATLPTPRTSDPPPPKPAPVSCCSSSCASTCMSTCFPPPIPFWGSGSRSQLLQCTWRWQQLWTPAGPSHGSLNYSRQCFCAQELGGTGQHPHAHMHFPSSPCREFCVSPHPHHVRPLEPQFHVVLSPPLVPSS
jgi:hypothetical protein